MLPNFSKSLPSCLQAQIWHKRPCTSASWDNRRWKGSDPLSSGLVVALGALQSSISLPLLQICSALDTIKSQRFKSLFCSSLIPH